jgi:flagellar basal-body rod modification protein FlgD
MAIINPNTVAPVAQSPTAPKAPSDAFGRDAFMKLLVEQMRHQSPSDASDGQAWINQMTQFSILEQLQQQSAGQAKADAAAYLGRTVSWATKDGRTGTGIVEKVAFDAGKPSLTVAGQAGITPADIVEVR